MLELFIAALVQFSVLFGGTAQKTTVSAPATITIQSAAAPAPSTNIGGTGWDDRN